MKEFTVVTKENFDEVLASNKTVLLDFWAAWCGPCRAMHAVLEQVDREDVCIGLINIDEQPELMQRFKIMSIPALYLIRDGAFAQSRIGLQSLPEIEEMLDQ